MPIKKAQFVIKGMTRDIAASKFSADYAFENQNMRLVATDDNTTGILTNEKGNLKVTSGIFENGLEVIPVGQAVIDNNLILFVKGTEGGASTVDHIYKINFNDQSQLVGELLYEGHLNLDPEHPLETICVYENDKVKKVYWTDGVNQPRVINIAADTTTKNRWSNSALERYIKDPFDFVRQIKLRESVTITRNLVANGMFAPGTIQYFLTYCNKNGQQSNIFYNSPLYYISNNNRGAGGNDTLGVSFTIQINGCDKSYDTVRIYAIHRTSLNATSQARKVVELNMPIADGNTTIIYTDYGTAGEAIDPTDLYFLGGKVVTTGTLTQKDNTLFVGNLGYKTLKLKSEDWAVLISRSTLSTDTYKNISVTTPSGYYSYTNQLKYNSRQITTYKYGETYRFGLQFQNKYGIWSDVYWLEDKAITIAPQRSSNTTLSVPKPTFTFDESSDETKYLPSVVADGFVRVRPVVVFPSTADRTVICQGVLAPTVYNVQSRLNHYPDIQSSWFFRPNAPYSTDYDIDNGSTSVTELTAVMSNHKPAEDQSTQALRNLLDGISNKGKWAEFRHNYPIPGNLKSNAEIQCISNPPDPFLGIARTTHYNEPTNPDAWGSANRECFYVDQSVVTFHSPDIEFDKEIRSVDSSGLSMRIVGWVPINSSVSDIDIITSTNPLNYSSGPDREYPDVAPGKYKETVSAVWGQRSYGWKSMLSGVFWLDEFYGSDRDNSGKGNVGFVIYPWHRDGSLNNTRTVSDSETKSSMLKEKKMSILRWSYSNTYLSPANFWTGNGISGISVYDSEEATSIKIPAPQNSYLDDLVYQGNIDDVIMFHTIEKDRTLDSDIDINPRKEEHTNSFYPIVAASNVTPTNYNILGGIQPPESINFRRSDSHVLFSAPYFPLRKFERDYQDHVTVSDYVSSGVHSCSNDPVEMKYKSTPHAVIALNYTAENKQVILPSMYSVNNLNDTTYSNALFWDPKYNTADKIAGISQDSMAISSGGLGYLWLAELYNPSVNPTNRFGGTSAEAIENNQWMVAGKSELLADQYGNAVTSFTVEWTEGDTYFQRYDCLKTYPFTLHDKNSVVDILSFMCETRVNIDGRYDRNRGQSSNLYMTPLNFNLFNPSYSQRDNFFTYRGYNSNKPVIEKFPNTVSWTKTKTLGEDIDTWTNITLASTLDLDGDKGEIRALERFNDSILAFQDTAVSQILYNENVQITSTAGVPIEIANSGKVQGKRYISNMIGCTNKFSICTTPYGLYFVDSLTKDIYLYNGQFNNLSDKYGFHSWTVNNLGNINPWNPQDFNGCVTYYDKVNNDVFFITEETALAFSETAGQFTSFYDYGKTPYFINLRDRGIAFHKDSADNKYYPYLHREGEYNSFFGEYKPFWTTVVVNPNPTEDKVFNNLEFRADAFDSDGDYDKDYTFDSLDTWNEYQEGHSDLMDRQDYPSTLKKKFRVWRANIPRWNVDKNGYTANCRDRMRNPWLYLRLGMMDENNLAAAEKVVLHDLVVDYFE